MNADRTCFDQVADLYAEAREGYPEEVVDLLCELRDEGTTIVAATHDARLARDPRVDRAVTVRDGALVP